MSTDSPATASRRRNLARWIDLHFKGVQSNFVAATGINQGELSGLLRNKSFGEKRARSLEAAAGMPPGYLDVHDEKMGTPANTPRHLVAEAATPPYARGNFAEDETTDDYVRVSQLDAMADMGDGAVNDDFPEVIRGVDYTRNYLRSLMGFVPPPGRLILITGRGNSMVPVINPGESLLVDTGITQFDGDGIYLLNTGNGQQVKALQDRGDAIYVVSANAETYPAFPAPAGMLIAGKVYLRNRIDRFN